MELNQHYSLKSYNTFAIDVLAKYFISPSTVEEILDALSNDMAKGEKKLILGGGSNILFTGDFDGLVIHPDLKGKSIIEKSGGQVLVQAMAGENWDEFVAWTVDHSFAGLENLSLIPGTVGACPVQNIGAYGVEAGDLIEKLVAVEISTGKIVEFSRADCKFAYRNSIFKQEIKNQFIITSVFFRLNLNPVFNTHYGQLGEELIKLGPVSLSTVRQAVIHIRQSKLPDPESIPNAGSFFKNPFVPAEKARRLKTKFPDMISYPDETGFVKLAAAWLIDHLGWKGKIINGAGVHDKQALVLVNHHQANGHQILELASKIKESVYKEFEVELEFEVNII